MEQPFSIPDSYIFSDLLEIHTITVEGEDAYLQGYYHNPVLGLMQYSYFEISFHLLYDLLSNNDFDPDMVRIIDEMAVNLSETDEPRMIEAGNEPFVFLGILFRFTAIVERDEEAENPDTSMTQIGLKIEDWVMLQEGPVTLEQYLEFRKEGLYSDSKLPALEQSIKELSGYISLLTLRFLYYKELLLRGESTDRALNLSSLDDQTTFAMAEVAYRIIADMGGWTRDEDSDLKPGNIQGDSEE